MNSDANGYRIEPMRLRDIDEVLKVEVASFSCPWSRLAFVSEILENERAHYFVACMGERVVGYIGAWLIFDEAHITNVAVAPEYRGQGSGRSLLEHLFIYCLERGVNRATLEVRPTNHVAQHLYASMGFSVAGVRKGYYRDNNEDAIVMWKELGGPLPG